MSRHGLLVTLLFSTLLAPAAVHSQLRPELADSIRHEAGRLAAEGRLDDARNLVRKHAADLPAVWNAMFAGKLEEDGDAASRGYTGASADSAPDQMRGEAIFRLGQYHYAADRFHFAIPQFRLYLARHPNGLWSQESAYWMAHSCIQFVKRRPDRASYLDTALAYLKLLDAKGPRAYYWPLGRAAQARVYLMRGDTAAAARALQEARERAPLEEVPGMLLLSLQADPHGDDAAMWEDSLRWSYPLSPEAMSLPKPALGAARPKPRPAPAPPSVAPSVASSGRHSLQLGAFAQRENADRLRAELLEKSISARVEILRAGNRILYRVLAGHYADAATATNEGKRLLAPLGYEYRVVEL